MNKRIDGKPSSLTRKRLAACRKAMRRERIGAFLVSGRMDAFYLIGFTGEDSALLILPKAVHVISDGRFVESINQECPWVRRWIRRGSLNAEIAAVSAKLNLRSLAVQAEKMTLADRDEITRLNRRTRMNSSPPILAPLRRCKDPTELSYLRKALRVAEDAFLVTRKSIRLGQTELELAARLEYEMKRRGASGPSFATICAEGPNAALPHAHPGNRKVRSGSAILFDWGARVGMYCSDLTRMVYIDTIPAKLGAVHDVVLAAQRKAITAIRPGARMCDVDGIARAHIAGSGYGEAFNHGLGHGLGLDVHEAPSLSWRSDEELQAGMVVTVEPGVYLPGVGGVRIEDDVLVTTSGCRTMSRLPKSSRDSLLRVPR